MPVDSCSVSTGETHMSERPIHRVSSGDQGRRGRWNQLAEALLAAGAVLAGELDVDEDESDELDDSFAELDESDELEDSEELDELAESAFAEEDAVFELLSRESVA